MSPCFNVGSIEPRGASVRVSRIGSERSSIIDPDPEEEVLLERLIAAASRGEGTPEMILDSARGLRPRDEEDERRDASV